MNNTLSHLHPESICFMIYCSKENSIVHFSPCEQCLKSFASGKYLFHDVELKRKFYSPKFVFLVNNVLSHLHPESIGFIMYNSKENSIVWNSLFLWKMPQKLLEQARSYKTCQIETYENYFQSQGAISLWNMRQNLWKKRLS